MLAKWDKCDEVKKKKKKGLFGEALFLTISHVEVFVIDNKSIILCPPFCKSWIHHYFLGEWMRRLERHLTRSGWVNTLSIVTTSGKAL